jgi:hypothetical protein
MFGSKLRTLTQRGSLFATGFSLAERIAVP